MLDSVSVVVPVYRAEAFLRRCVESVLKQTYGNLEIILVDDGSPDSCPDICDEYAEKDKRIVVIHKENGGASSARNAGLNIMTGRYLCFVDSDDEVPENAVQSLLDSVTDSGAQYAAGICGIKNSDSVKNPIPESRIIDFNDEPHELLGYLVQRGSYSPYAKIFDADIIRRENIRYDENLKCSEDALFIRSYLKYCEKISLCSEVVYRYNTENPSSLSKKGHSEYDIYFEKKLNALKELTEMLPISNEEKEEFLAERALSGLRGSIRHYSTFKFEKKRYVLTEHAIRLLRPWFEDFDPSAIRDSELKKWYTRYAERLKSERLTSIAKRLTFKERVKCICEFLKGKAVRMLRR